MGIAQPFRQKFAPPSAHSIHSCVSAQLSATDRTTDRRTDADAADSSLLVCETTHANFTAGEERRKEREEIRLKRFSLHVGRSRWREGVARVCGRKLWWGKLTTYILGLEKVFPDPRAFFAGQKREEAAAAGIFEHDSTRVQLARPPDACNHLPRISKRAVCSLLMR